MGNTGENDGSFSFIVADEKRVTSICEIYAPRERKNLKYSPDEGRNFKPTPTEADDLINLLKTDHIFNREPQCTLVSVKTHLRVDSQPATYVWRNIQIQNGTGGVEKSFAALTIDKGGDECRNNNEEELLALVKKGLQLSLNTKRRCHIVVKMTKLDLPGQKNTKLKAIHIAQNKAKKKERKGKSMKKKGKSVRLQVATILVVPLFFFIYLIFCC